MNAEETQKWAKAHNSKNYPYCGWCFHKSVGKWGHCSACDVKRLQYEASVSAY